MTREEILEKSRVENKHMDEREQNVSRFSKGVSGAFGLLLCMLLNLINSSNHGPEAVGHAMWTIASGIYAAEHITNAIHLKQKHYWILAITFTCLCIAHLSRYLGLLL